MRTLLLNLQITVACHAMLVEALLPTLDGPQRNAVDELLVRLSVIRPLLELREGGAELATRIEEWAQAVLSALDGI